MSAYIASAERWYIAGKSCADVAVCTLSGQASGKSGCGCRASSSIRLSSSSRLHGSRRRCSSTRVEAAPSSTSAVVSIPSTAASTAAPNRPAEVVPGVEAVPARLPVAEPEVPGRDVAAAALQEDALDAGQPGLDGLAERPREVRVPEQRLAADHGRMAGEARDDRERAPVLGVDPKHRHAVVDGALPTHAVDADAGRAAAAPADARRLPRAPGRVDGSGEQVRQALDVRRERSGVGQPRHGRAARHARRAVVVRRVDEHGLGRDPGQPLHALADRRGHVRAGEHEVARDDRDRGAPVVEDERLGDHRLADAVGQAGAGRPAAVGQAAGRGDVGARDACLQCAHGRSFLTGGRPARRRPPAAAS